MLLANAAVFDGQAVLAHLVRDRAGYHVKRLAQELTHSTIEHGQVGRKLSYLLSDSHRFPNIAEALLAMLSSNATNPADVIKVRRQRSALMRLGS